jgi:hypothetical protein
MDERKPGRREFIRDCVHAGVASGLLQAGVSTQARAVGGEEIYAAGSAVGTRAFNGVFRAPYSDQIAFPMAGMDAGMVCLEGTGGQPCFSARGKSIYLHSDRNSAPHRKY